MSSQNKLLRISIQCHPSLEEPLCNFLLENGCAGVELQEGAEAMLIRGFLPHSKTSRAVCDRFETLTANLKQLSPEIPKPDCRVSLVPDRDWHQMWKRSFKPLRIAPDLIVQPTWWETNKPPEAGTIVLKIDPKSGFGTGHHPSTKLSLLALREAVKPEDRFLDYGCGSGILAIYAAKLGASEVLGVDNDPEAIDCARENVVENGVADIVKIGNDPRSVKRHYYDLAVANIDLATLRKLAPRITRALRKGGVAIFSGILSEESASIKALTRKKEFRPLRTYEEKNWIAVLCETSKRKAASTC